MSHKHQVGIPVVLWDTREVGTLIVQLPPKAGKFRYRVSVRGRPATPGQPEGTPGTREVDEEIILLDMTPADKVIADALMVGGMRGLPLADRISLKFEQEAVRDAPSSSHKDINEAIRFLDAISIVEEE